MNHFKSTIAATVICALSGTVYAQQEQTASEQKYSAVVRSEDSSYRLRASDVIGMEVQNYTQENIGEVDDLILGSDNEGAKAVISVGGFLGIGDRLVTVPYEELQRGTEGDYLIYNATQEQLEGMPEFEYNEGESWGYEIRQSQLPSPEMNAESEAEQAIAITESAVDDATEAVQDMAGDTEEVAESTQDMAEDAAEAAEDAAAATEEAAEDAAEATEEAAEEIAN